MALHGGGHLELKKMHKGDFWGLSGIRLERCPCIIPEKISFLQFYTRFNPNALALVGVVAKMLRAAVMAHERDDNPTVEKTHPPTISHSHVSLGGYFGKCTFIGRYQQICGKNFPSTDRSNLALTKFIAK